MIEQDLDREANGTASKEEEPPYDDCSNSLFGIRACLIPAGYIVYPPFRLAAAVRLWGWWRILNRKSQRKSPALFPYSFGSGERI